MYSGMIELGDEFGPQIALNAEDILPLMRVETLVRIERINHFDGQESADSPGFVLEVARRVVVQIAVRVGSHNHMVAALGRFDAAGEPRHDMTVAVFDRPPSRISSQPMIFRPFPFRNFSMRCTK